MRFTRRCLHALDRVAPSAGRLVRRLAGPLRPSPRARYYGEQYFAGRAQREPGVSGYGNYRRASSNADVAAYLLWRFLPFRQSFDVGCAKGFVVEALRELGYDAAGADISEFAISQATPEVRPHLEVLDLASRRSRRRFRGRRFDLVTTLEVLEHLEPAQVPSALRFLRSISSGWLVATIPSVGVNRNGPDGLFGGKVEPEVLASYRAQAGDFVGPVPYDDLLKANDGFPHEGHLCIASFEWWTQAFEEAGFRRVDAVERRMHPVIGRMELSVAWNLYVFHVDDREPPALLERTEAELAEVEDRWGLHDRPGPQHAINITRDTVGEEAVAAIYAELEGMQQRRLPASTKDASG